MRSSLFAAVFLVLASTASAQGTLYVVGDGRDVLVTDSDDETGTWLMSTDEPGDDESESVFRVHGPFNVASYQNPFIPTWTYDGAAGAVNISGENPVTVYAYVDDAFGGLCGGIVAQLFDGAGEVIGPEEPPVAEDPNAPPSIDEVSWEFEGIAGEFPGLSVQAAPLAPHCSHVDFYFGSLSNPTRIELGEGDYIGTPPPPPPEEEGRKTIHANLTGASADVTLQYPSFPANRTFIYSWENPHERLNITYDVFVSKGSLDLRIDEVEGETVLQHMVDEDATHNATWDGAGPGDWTITVALHHFSGRLRLSIQDAGEAPPSTDTQTQTDTGTKDPTGTGTTTGTPPETGTETDNETPGFGLVAGLALLIMAGRAVRRRLD